MLTPPVIVKVPESSTASNAAEEPEFFTQTAMSYCRLRSDRGVQL